MANDTPPIELMLISEDSRNEIVLKNERGSLTFPKEDLSLHLDMTVQHHPHSREGSLTPMVIHYLAPDEQNILRKLGTGFWQASLGTDGNVSLKPDPKAVISNGTSPVLSGITLAKRSFTPAIYPGLTHKNMHMFSTILKFPIPAASMPRIEGNTGKDIEAENQALASFLSQIDTEYVMSGSNIYPFDAESKTFREPIQPRSSALLGYPVDLLRIIEAEPRLDEFKQRLCDTGIPVDIVERITSGDPTYPVTVIRSDIGALPEELLADFASKVRYQIAHKIGQQLLIDYKPGSTNVAERLRDALEEPLMYKNEDTIPFYAESALLALGASYGEDLKEDCQTLSFDDEFYTSLANTLNKHYTPDPLEPSLRPGMR